MADTRNTKTKTISTALLQGILRQLHELLKFLARHEQNEFVLSRRVPAVVIPETTFIAYGLKFALHVHNKNCQLNSILIHVRQNVVHNLHVA